MTQRSPGRRDRVTRTTSPRPARIAVDLLGGDNAPAVVVDGVLRALAADPDGEIVLVGPRAVAVDVHRRLAEQVPAERLVGGRLPADLLPEERGSIGGRVRTIVAERGVGMAESVRRGCDPTTSIGAGMLALAQRQIDAFVSAGSSGAIVTSAVRLVGRSDRVRRPPLAALLPGGHAGSDPSVLLDVGANMQASVADLVTNAALGSAYAQLMTSNDSPRVGLLSVGAEPGKGDRLRKTVDSALRTHRPNDPRMRYIGLVEGNDLVIGGRADVVVTDGFTGNVVLKAIEAGSARAATMREAAAREAAAREAMARDSREALPRAAALLGVNGIVVVCHGGADGEDVASGVALAARLVRIQMVAQVTGIGLVKAGVAVAKSPPAGEAGGLGPTQLARVFP